ncbi:MAG: hypothetical protein E6I63_12490 [Chloroflexi bacterium]|nr:MAG: hypothetical protein E6I63_12490 [Chloroflexota bacterium]
MSARSVVDRAPTRSQAGGAARGPLAGDRPGGAVVTPQGTIPATGKTVSLPSIGIYELRDGKLAGSRGMYDRLDVMSQLGLLGASAQA